MCIFNNYQKTFCWNVFTSTKASLNDFIQSAALEFSKDLIRFNSINLGIFH